MGRGRRKPSQSGEVQVTKAIASLEGDFLGSDLNIIKLLVRAQMRYQKERRIAEGRNDDLLEGNPETNNLYW